jgi:hypothetical protein
VLYVPLWAKVILVGLPESSLTIETPLASSVVLSLIIPEVVALASVWLVLSWKAP